MKNPSLLVATAVAVMALAGTARAEAYKIEDPAVMAKAMAAATVKLDQGIKATAAQGTPISAKYELDEKGALQLSVYTAKGADFLEVVVDNKTGVAKTGEKITDANDLKAAKDQSTTMGKAKMTLEQAAAKASADNAGYTVMSAIPAMQGTSPVAEVELMKGTDVKAVSIKLD